MQETEYLVGFELMNGSISTWSSLENRNAYPFGENEFNRFFQRFFDLSFKFPGDFGCILIYDAKENDPRHSYAIGWLFAENMDEFNIYFKNTGDFPNKLGEITFEYGGNIASPRISVKKF